MNRDEALLRTQFFIEDHLTPWTTFIGLVELQLTPYLERGAMYALDPSGTDYKDLPQAVLVNPADVEQARAVACKKTGRTMSDAELAAYLWWRAMQHRQVCRDFIPGPFDINVRAPICLMCGRYEEAH